MTAKQRQGPSESDLDRARQRGVDTSLRDAHFSEEVIKGLRNKIRNRDQSRPTEDPSTVDYEEDDEEDDEEEGPFTEGFRELLASCEGERVMTTEKTPDLGLTRECIATSDKEDVNLIETVYHEQTID